MFAKIDHIESLIPQRPPFVMIDQLTGYDENSARSVFIVREDNIFVDNNRFCEPGLVENIAQTAAARAGYTSLLENKNVQVGYIGAIKNLLIHALPFVHDELLTTISVENQVFDVMIIKGTVHCKNILLASCEMKIFITPSK